MLQPVPELSWSVKADPFGEWSTDSLAKDRLIWDEGPSEELTSAKVGRGKSSGCLKEVAVDEKMDE